MPVTETPARRQPAGQAGRRYGDRGRAERQGRDSPAAGAHRTRQQRQGAGRQPDAGAPERGSPQGSRGTLGELAVSEPRRVVWGAVGVVGSAVAICNDGSAWCLVERSNTNRLPYSQLPAGRIRMGGATAGSRYAGPRTTSWPIIRGLNAAPTTVALNKVPQTHDNEILEGNR